jgi:predicted PurR-regulated permease PerM
MNERAEYDEGVSRHKPGFGGLSPIGVRPMRPVRSGSRDDDRQARLVNLRFWQRMREHGAAATARPIGSSQLEELSSVFAAPRWLRDLGRSAWLLAGVFLILAGLVWLLGATSTIVDPMLAAVIVATVAIPVVSALQRHRVPRAAGAVLVLLLILTAVAVIVVLVIAGITGQHDEISDQLSAAVDKAGGWMGSLGVDDSGVSSAEQHVSSTTPTAIATLVKGVIHGISSLAALALSLSFAMLGVFFLLKDGPTLRRWVDGHLGVPPDVARTITGGVIRSLRGYFLGVTIVAVFNAIVVGIGSLALGVPLAGTIAVVTFVTAYVPYIGAFVSGAFAVLIALGSKGTTTAVIMLVIVILANGLLQNIFQPFAMGSALDLHPLAVLIITIAAGCVFGMVGLVLAAPLTSAAVHITHDLASARAAAGLTDAAPNAPPLDQPAT